MQNPNLHNIGDRVRVYYRGVFYAGNVFGVSLQTRKAPVYGIIPYTPTGIETPYPPKEIRFTEDEVFTLDEFKAVVRSKKLEDIHNAT